MTNSHGMNFEAPVRTGLTAGYCAIFTGGIIAAITGPLNLTKGSWLAAYLVLIAGLAQLLLVYQSRLLHLAARPAPSTWMKLGFWAAGNVAVIAGSLISQPVIVDLGGLALISALVIALAGTRGAPLAVRAWLLRACYVAVLLSIPIGLILAHVRAT